MAAGHRDGEARGVGEKSQIPRAGERRRRSRGILELAKKALDAGAGDCFDLALLQIDDSDQVILGVGDIELARTVDQALGPMKTGGGEIAVLLAGLALLADGL